MNKYNDHNHPIFQQLLLDIEGPELYSISKNIINEMWYKFSYNMSANGQKSFPLNMVTFFSKKKIKVLLR